MTSNGSGKYNSASFRLTRLYERRSKNGVTYYAGRLGGARIVLLKSKDTGDNGEAILDLLVSEAPPPRQDGQGGPQRQPTADDGRRDWQAPAADERRPTNAPAIPTATEIGDEIPF